MSVSLARTPLQAISTSRASYQRVFSLWKNADPDLEIAQQIKAEFQALEPGE